MSYPLTLATLYFETHTGKVDPAVVARANEKLSMCYQRLLGFECKDGGFEWWGKGDGHEALTAYGILQFHSMAKVYPVDEDLLRRSRQWLMSRRNDEGGFNLNARSVSRWGVQQHIADAYIVWSLSEAGDGGLEDDVNRLLKQATERDDPYFNGLVALSLFNTGRADEGKALLARIGRHQHDDGYVGNADATIVNSRGNALLIETTAVAVMAWLQGGREYAGKVEKAMQWLTAQCQNGRFGPTQSTVLALKAVVAYDRMRSYPKADGEVVLLINGEQWGTVPFSKDQLGAIELPSFADVLPPGNHRIELQMRDGSPMPYTMEVSFHSMLPSNHPDCPLDLTVTLSDTRVNEGEATEVNVTVTNLDQAERQNMAMVIVGLPGGMEPRHDKLRELREQEIIDSYEVIGRDVVFYIEELTPGQTLSFSFDVIAAVPGSYTGDASRTYLYYGDEYRKWVAGLQATILPRQ